MPTRLLRALLALVRLARRRAEQPLAPGDLAGFTAPAIDAARWLH